MSNLTAIVPAQIMITPARAIQIQAKFELDTRASGDATALAKHSTPSAGDLWSAPGVAAR